jgi:rhamnosyl/mannosyltransferase
MVGVKANLVIVGEGRLRRKMEEVARNLNLDKKVFFVGKVSAADLKAYLHACEVFCLPSIYNSEAFGLVQLEAMACAKPIVNTDLPTGVTLISKDGESGLTVPPKDVSALTLALNTLMVNEGERIKFGAKALERVKHLFSLNKMLNDIFALYNSLV